MVCDAQAIGIQVDSWIAENELPVGGRLHVIRRFDEVRQPMIFEDEDFNNEELKIETEAYYDFVSWYLSKDWQSIMSIPQKYSDAWFPQREFDEQGNDISAFNTVDFQRLNGWKPNVEAWQLKQIMDKLYDLAQTHSCITNEEGRKNIKDRFDKIVYKNFTSPYLDFGQAKYLKRLHEAEKIWEKTAFQI
jgi:hypothetical protein